MICGNFKINLKVANYVADTLVDFFCSVSFHHVPRSTNTTTYELVRMGKSYSSVFWIDCFPSWVISLYVDFSFVVGHCTM